MNDNIISREKYNYYKNYLGYEDFFEKIKGKKLVDEYLTIEDCGLHYVGGLLNSDWGMTIVVTYDKYEMEFIKSKCLSDYFKEGIEELLSSVMTKEIKDVLNNGKDINKMDENEIKILYDAVDEYYNDKVIDGSPANVSIFFEQYLYKLDGNGVTSFIKNNISGESIARRILLTSGLNDRASYYSGRGVVYSDLNENNLTEIFNKLLKLDSEYALSFIEMVCDMKTLGATEFINSFIRLGINKFKYEKMNRDESNVSFDGVNDEARFGVAVGTILSSFGRGNDSYQIEASEQMKSSFLYKIKNSLINMKVESAQMIVDKYFDNWRDSYGKYHYRRR